MAGPSSSAAATAVGIDQSEALPELGDVWQMVLSYLAPIDLLAIPKPATAEGKGKKAKKEGVPALICAPKAAVNKHFASLLPQEVWAGALAKRWPQGVHLLDDESPAAAYCSMHGDPEQPMCRCCRAPLSNGKGGAEKALHFFFSPYGTVPSKSFIGAS